MQNSLFWLKVWKVGPFVVIKLLTTVSLFQSWVIWELIYKSKQSTLTKKCDYMKSITAKTLLFYNFDRDKS